MEKSQILNLKSSGSRAAGFTILEMLVVISIIAIVSTFATSAALRSMKQGRVRRLEASCRSLEMALVNYRTQEGAWPFKLSDMSHSGNSDFYWAHGENNRKVFKKLYHGPGSDNQTAYLDASTLLTLVKGQRMQLRAALEASKTDIPLIYPDTSQTTKTRYYCVEYNRVTDSIKVHTQSDHGCPNWKN